MSSSFAPQDVSELVKLLTERGYFHHDGKSAGSCFNNSNNNNNNNNNEHSSVTTSTLTSTSTQEPTLLPPTGQHENDDSQQQQQQQIHYSFHDLDCQIILKTTTKAKAKAKDQLHPSYSSFSNASNDTSKLVSSSSSSSVVVGYLTRTFLLQQLHTLLQRVGGRISLVDAAHLLTVDQQILQQQINMMQQQQQQHDENDDDDDDENVMIVLEQNQHVLLISTYFDTIIIPHARDQLMMTRNGCIRVSDIALHFHLPLDVCIQQLAKRMKRNQHQQQTSIQSKHTKSPSSSSLSSFMKLMTFHGTKAIVIMPWFEQYERKRVRGIFAGLFTPTSIESIVDVNSVEATPIPTLSSTSSIHSTINNNNHNNSMSSTRNILITGDVPFVMNMVRDLIRTNELQGELHGASSNHHHHHHHHHEGISSTTTTTTTTVTAMPIITSGAMYVPAIYSQMQRQAMKQHFETQGIVSVETCMTLGIGVSNMGRYVQQSYPHAIEYSKVVIDKERIINPILPVIQAASAEHSFADLRLYLPDSLLLYPQDVMTIVMPYVMEEDGRLVMSRENKGAKAAAAEVVVGQVVFVSQGMIQSIQNKLLPPLMEQYAQERAAQLESSFQNNNHNIESMNHHPNDTEPISVSSKKSSKNKRSNKKSNSTRNSNKDTSSSSSSAAAASSSENIIPLASVAKCILNAYPDLAELQDTSGPSFSTTTTTTITANALTPEIPWEIEEDDDNKNNNNSNNNKNSDDPSSFHHIVVVVIELCRQILYTPSFCHACRLAVQAEVDRRNAIVQTSRKDGATKVRSIEASFEESFATACHLLYLHLKFLDHVVNTTTTMTNVHNTNNQNDDNNAEQKSDDNDNNNDDDNDDGSKRKLEKMNLDAVEILQQEFLRYNCADFASRITQYCLFKNELEDDLFSFQTMEDDAETGPSTATTTTTTRSTTSTLLPSYCQPIPLACPQFPRPFLSCMDQSDGLQPTPKPLPMLRKVLSGHLGTTLARLWILCGGDCYDGGAPGGPPTGSSGSTRTTSRCCHEFLAFVEEHCLSICGIPFRTMNKKMEKQFLFARRQELTAALQQTVEPIQVLELVMIILFQQLRGFVIVMMTTRSSNHTKRIRITEIILRLLCSEKKMPQPVAIMLQQLADQCLRNNNNDDNHVDVELVRKVKEFGLCRDITKQMT